MSIFRGAHWGLRRKRRGKVVGQRVQEMKIILLAKKKSRKEEEEESSR